MRRLASIFAPLLILLGLAGPAIGVFAAAAGAGANTIHQAGDTQMSVYSGTMFD
jgi:hypothetical protein